MFGFKGRIGRLAFVICAVASFAANLLLICLGIATTQSPEGLVLGLVLVAAEIVSMVWVSFALTIKRLHDLSLAGTHLVWINLLNLAAGGTAELSPVGAYLLGLISFGVSCWLIFQRGADGPNQYGEPPGGAVRQDVLSA